MKEIIISLVLKSFIPLIIGISFLLKLLDKAQVPYNFKNFVLLLCALGLMTIGVLYACIFFFERRTNEKQAFNHRVHRR